MLPDLLIFIVFVHILCPVIPSFQWDPVLSTVASKQLSGGFEAKNWTDVLLKAVGNADDDGRGSDLRKGTILSRQGAFALSLRSLLLST